MIMGGYLNLLLGLGVDKGFYGLPDHLEEAGGVDDAGVAKHLWVVVLVDGHDLAQHLLDLSRQVLEAHPCNTRACSCSRCIRCNFCSNGYTIHASQLTVNSGHIQRKSHRGYTAFVRAHSGSIGAFTFHVDDGKGLVDVAASDDAAGRHDLSGAALVLLHMEPDHALLCSHLLHLLVVDGPQVLNVDRPPLIKHPVKFSSHGLSQQVPELPPYHG